jgi:hypothetical protein
VPGVLIGVGVVLILMMFLLAFTIFGAISALLGIASIAIGAVMLSHRAAGRGPGPPSSL